MFWCERKTGRRGALAAQWPSLLTVLCVFNSFAAPKAAQTRCLARAAGDFKSLSAPIRGIIPPAAKSNCLSVGGEGGGRRERGPPLSRSGRSRRSRCGARLLPKAYSLGLADDLGSEGLIPILLALAFAAVRTHVLVGKMTGTYFLPSTSTNNPMALDLRFLADNFVMIR